MLQDTSDATKARLAALLANETSAKAYALECLRGAVAGKQALAKDAAKLEVAVQQQAGGLGGKVDALMADGSAALWSSLDEGLRDWRAAVGEQEERLAALKAETRCYVTRACMTNPYSMEEKVHVASASSVFDFCRKHTSRSCSKSLRYSSIASGLVSPITQLTFHPPPFHWQDHYRAFRNRSQSPQRQRCGSWCCRHRRHLCSRRTSVGEGRSVGRGCAKGGRRRREAERRHCTSTTAAATAGSCLAGYLKGRATFVGSCPMPNEDTSG